MDPSSAFANKRKPSAVFSKLEIKACRALYELQFLRKRPRTWDGLLESLPFSWGVRGPRTKRLHVSTCHSENAETKDAPTEVRKEEPPVVSRKIRIIGRTQSERVAMVVLEPESVSKAPPLPPQGIATLPFVGSPTSPLLHGSMSVSSQGEQSDSNYSRGPSLFLSPQDHPLPPKHRFEVETKAKVHTSPNSRGPMKKTVAELKDRVNEQLMLKEELERERKMWVDCCNSLRDENRSLKEQLVLKSEKKEEDKLLLCSLDSSQQTMLPHSRINHSSSGRVILPDLNIPLEESSENSSGDFCNQLLKTDKLVAAAHARKYRMGYLRYLRHKKSQSRNL